MRIIIAHSHLNTFGGGERAVLELMQRLSVRHDVTLWAGNYAPTDTFAEFADLARRDISTLGWLTASPQADAIVTHTFGANLLALHHPHTICYLHSLRSVYARGGRRPDLALRRILERRALRKASAILTNSAFSAELARQLYGLRLDVLSLGADEPLLALPPRLGSYALYVGRLAPEKGLERLLAWSCDLPIDLKIVGRGERGYVSYLHSLAGPRATFCGALTGPDLAAAYAGCRYFVFLPHDEEFGLAALDALATSKPVIAAREGGLIELVRDGENGFLVGTAEEFALASSRLIADGALCLQMGARAHEDAQAYSWDSYTRAIEARCVSANADTMPSMGVACL
ncbi:MAG TPA: glycosyltransferase family 4 protein [Ktedonobacterales bacterium]|jgi:glycosyltransferase involved in cell wall biosynthesis|nr:glycosyltransferase family 4 protein [Ktedonobacterales bacterium]